MQRLSSYFMGAVVLAVIAAFTLSPLSVFQSPATIAAVAGGLIVLIGVAAYAVGRFWKVD
jgi:hypothetical protein